MPVLTSTTAPALYDLANRLNADLTAGTPTRQVFGAQDAAFGWANNSMPRIIATHVSNAKSEAMSFGALVVGNSATPAAAVAPGAPKPDAVTLDSVSVPLLKYAGKAQWQLEQQMNTDGLVFALYSVIAAQCMLAYDVAVAAAMDAATTPMTAATDWSSAILGGIAAVVGNGGAPDLLVMNGADYAAAVQPGQGYVASPEDATQQLYGLRIAMSATVPAGFAYVLDSAAVTCVQHVNSPTAILDPFTLADTNEIRLVVDLFAGVVVNAPGLVAAVNKAP